MATQIIKKLLDDLDGGDADETMHFSFDGSAYKIDLSTKNAKKFRELMSQYQEAAERIGRQAIPPQPVRNTYSAAKPSGSTAVDREQNKAIREWANKNGYELAERGRIPQHIMDAFQSNTPNPAWVAKQKEEALKAEMTPATVPAPRKRASKATAAAAK